MNNNIKDNKKTLESLTGIKKGTTEQGALKTIHQNYNKLNGYEAMLHIINRYRFVLYPFIFLSIAGSSYSFYNDFLKAFPILGDMNLTIAIFFSIMLEIVRDGSLIALFNSKMRKPSRILVSFIFVAVTTYMYSSHLKAIKVIEQKAIEYTLTHQNQNEINVKNPRFSLANQELKELKKELEDKKAEKTDKLIANSTSIYKNKRESALKRIEQIDTKIEEIKKQIRLKNEEIIKYKNENIKDIQTSQEVISNILLATLLLVESLAMLGAVIKFINKDNAQKEIAKHSEIVEEYVSISEQMKQDNEELTKNLSNVVKGQSESNQNVMKMISDDMRQSANLNIQFIQAIAQNKRDTMQQMNQVLQMINSSTVPTLDIKQVQTVAHHQEEQPQRKIGFIASSEEDLVKGLFQDGYLKANDKLTSKTMLIDINNRTEDKTYKEVMRKLSTHGIVEFKRGHGYYATETKGTLENALRVI
jgi:hypothetical protein